jgi:tetratricopeptide (TPR) repeat protein
MGDLGKGIASIADVKKKAGAADAAVQDARDKFRMKDYKGAVAALTDAIAKDPKNRDLWLMRSKANYAAGDYKAAYDDCTHVLNEDPNNVNALVLRSQAANALKDYRGAIADADRALALEPNNVQALINRAWAHLQLGQYTSALADAAKAALLDPKNATAFLYKAMAEEGLGRLEDALKDYAKAAGLDSALKSFYDDFVKGKGSTLTSKTPAIIKGFYVLLIGGLTLLLLLAPLLLRSKAGKATTSSVRNRWAAWAGIKPPEKTLAIAKNLNPGAVVGGVRVVGELGRGDWAATYEGFDEKGKRKLAIKELRQEPGASPEQSARFLKEVGAVCDFKHPRIAETYGLINDDDGRLWQICERLEGQSLDELLPAGKGLPLPTVRAVLADIAGALDYAHGRGAAHENLKPSNVMILPDGSSKVMDFGLPRTAADAQSSPYAAPEQARGSVTKAADVFALGALAYELLTGRAAFAGPDSSERKLKASFMPATRINPALPAGLDGFLKSALDPDPAKRPASAAAFLAGFDAASLPTPVPGRGA